MGGAQPSRVHAVSNAENASIRTVGIMNLTLRQLRYFGRIVEAGNITRAAKGLNLAPTALSFQVKEMEDRLGVKLLDRHSRGVRPTDRGSMLYQRSRQILALVRETESEVSEREVTRPVIEMGILPSMVRLLGLDSLHRAAGDAPSINLRFSEMPSQGQVAQLMSGELHFALARELAPLPELRWVDVLKERLVYVTAPQTARRSGQFQLHEILARELAFYREGDSIWRRVHAACSAADLAVPSAQIVGSFFMLRQMVAEGQVSAVAPLGLVQSDASVGRLAVHEIADQPIWHRISLAWRVDTEEQLPIEEVEKPVAALATELSRSAEGYLKVPRSA